MNRLAQALLVIAVALFLAAPTLAAKHVTPGLAEATITLDQSDPHYGDVVTFSVTTNATPTYVRLTCSQEGAVVAIGGWSIKSDLSYTSDRIGLNSPIWTGGGATCDAVVMLVTAQTFDHWRVIGETGFVVAP